MKISVYDCNSCVGYIIGFINTNWLKITDFMIFDQVPHYNFFFFNKLHKSYRNRGLGSAMIRHMISQVKNKSINYVIGDISKDDVKVTTHLFYFYEKNGFKINLIDNGIFIARIWLNLSNGFNNIN